MPEAEGERWRVFLAIEISPALQVAPIVETHHPIRLVARGVGAFPSVSRAQVVWAGISGTELPRLVALQGDLSDRLRQAGVPVEDRRFRPHLTLARVQRPLRAPERRRLQEWSSAWGDIDLGELPVTEVRLMRSQLGGGPPRYSTLASFALK